MSASPAPPSDPPRSNDPNAWTVGRLLNWTREHFEAKGIDAPRLAAELLLAEAMGCRKIELYTRFEQAPPAPQVARFRELVVKAANHEPISYLLGRREFFSLEFTVTPDVLIPRPETETLVERGLAYCKPLTTEHIHVWDMGTGSGCIAVSIARFEPRARVVASDISEAALAVAQTNAQRHGVSERLTFVAADGPSLPAVAVPPEKFDLLLSNPPYIREDAVSDLPLNIRNYEPHVALASGDGLTFYRRLAAEAGELLSAGGRCMVEFGMGQSASIAEIFGAQAGWSHVGSWKDMAGLDRVIGFERRA